MSKSSSLSLGNLLFALCVLRTFSTCSGRALRAGPQDKKKKERRKSIGKDLKKTYVDVEEDCDDILESFPMQSVTDSDRRAVNITINR